MLLLILAGSASFVGIIGGVIGIIAWAQNSARVRREEIAAAVTNAVAEITKDRDYYRNLVNELSKEIRERGTR